MRRDAWYQQIIKDGGSKELAGELADAYTPEVARFGKPPRVVFGTATSRTGLSKDGTELVIRAGADAAEIKKALGDFGHRLKRGTQYRIARENRYSREAKMIGARRIKGEHTREQDLKAVNPNFVPGRNGEWENNCQRCVYAYEARRRGIDVEALPRIQGIDNIAKQWKNICKGAEWQHLGCTNKSTAANDMNKAMAGYGEESRAVIYVTWENGGAHVFIAEHKNGKTTFIDPQSGKTDVANYFNQAKPDKILYCRIDNLKFSDYINGCCKRKN